jgi:hypothetical protein
MEEPKIDFIVRSLSKVVANGHGLIPVPHRDLRILLDAVRQERARYYASLSVQTGNKS